ncbi:hypothetical protein K456DRAFT_1732166 [Colletotrichum gloeosporioides 23]|nr:hypothetical protein K456DRAFT_1732166 [Colletotrichum gloeosporioides 23]
MSSEEESWMRLEENRDLEIMPRLKTTTNDSCEACPVADDQILDDADSSAEATEKSYALVTRKAPRA